MYQKKSLSSAAKRFLLGRLDLDEIPLTQTQCSSTSWSEDLLVDVPSTTSLSHDARGDCKETKATEQERTSSKNLNPPSSTSNMEDGTPAFSTTRFLSQVPRIQKWSSTSVARLSMIAVALSVAVVVSLVFTLRHKEEGRMEGGYDQRHSGVKVYSVARGTSATAETPRPGVLVKSLEHRHDTRGGDQQQPQDEGSYHLNFHNDVERGQSGQEGSQALSSSSTPDGVVWWNDDGFGRASSGDRAHSQRDPAAIKEDINEYDRRERRLARVDRKTYLNNVDTRLLQN
ncbi:uncharacterized protein LOC144107020 [Amblyomma americanum]